MTHKYRFHQSCLHVRHCLLPGITRYQERHLRSLIRRAAKLGALDHARLLLDLLGRDGERKLERTHEHKDERLRSVSVMDESEDVKA